MKMLISAWLAVLIMFGLVGLAYYLDQLLWLKIYLIIVLVLNILVKIKTHNLKTKNETYRLFFKDIKKGIDSNER